MGEIAMPKNHPFARRQSVQNSVHLKHVVSSWPEMPPILWAFCGEDAGCDISFFSGKCRRKYAFRRMVLVALADYT